ncbi:MAG: M24 family metallopeptidase, partial [Gemmataceae bacterium]|nr:M24 family metallopeptidase [Gemmataceae bacterium]
MFDLQATQAALRDQGLDGWLLCDFRGSNMLARRVLDLEQQPVTSRRWYYFVPTAGDPIKLVHRIEPGALDHLPGGKRIYLRWQQLEQELTTLVTGKKNVAMEYSPRNLIPYISRVDAGTVELIRSAGVNVVPSGDLIQTFEATWDDAQWEMHQEAARYTSSAYGKAFGFIAERVRRMGSVKETEVQRVILDHFAAHKMTTYSPPIVAVGPHSGDPHFETGPATDTAIKEGDFVLIDLWAKMDRPRAVYSDLTWVGFVGKETPDKHENVFQIVAQARDSAIQTVRDAFAAGRPLQGWEVDDAARETIEHAGYGEYFVHRTGH